MESKVIYNQDCIHGMKEEIKDETIDLIIADPPYFKVVGEKWDYKWRVEDDYLAWSRAWIFEAARTLRKGGSFYLFGYFRMLSKLLPVLEDAGLSLRQQIVINKGMKSVSGRATKNYKMFPNVTESILFLYKDPKPFVRALLKDRQKKVGITAKEINELLGVKSNGGGMWSIYTGNNICEQLPTKEYWGKLENILGYKYPYESLSITYNPQLGFTDVWDDIDFYEEKNRYHPTQKPQKLIRRLIKASSNLNDIVLDPFVGGGSTAIACANENRRFVGFEIDPDYYAASLERLQDFKNR
ncbi:MAG: site-specific DNA-methyltransferase [Defluviitaleaceae bacterium]|nr:site-specific DNA-methyltransferase [Defluviitaleaceae bacterium]MCL2262680.1 site-specific DNA-methyltransferase [Defluviitaleaceae bacterium]